MEENKDLNISKVAFLPFDFHSFAALLSELDWTRESASLQRNMAFGDAKHRRQVRPLLTGCRNLVPTKCVYARVRSESDVK